MYQPCIVHLITSRDSLGRGGVLVNIQLNLITSSLSLLGLLAVTGSRYFIALVSPEPDSCDSSCAFF